MPPRNLSIQPHHQQQQQDQQMSQALVDQQHAGVGVTMADQHTSHSLEHAHSLAEHAAHSMLDLSETGSTLEHLAGSGGHSAQSLVDMTSGQASDPSMDSVSANGGRRQPQSMDRISGVIDSGTQPMQPLSSNERELSSLVGASNGSSSSTLISRPLSSLGRISVTDRQGQPMRNLTPVGMDGRIGHLGGLAGSLAGDGRGSVGLGHSMVGGGNSSLQDHGANHYSPEQPSQNLLDSISSISSRGRPPSMGGAQHNLDQHGPQALTSHIRGLPEHPSHTHLVDHHGQQSVGRDAGSGSHNGQGGMSVFGLDSNNGHLHSRPGSTLLPEAGGHATAHDLSRGIYSSSSTPGDPMGNHQPSSLIDETIASVASNLDKPSPNGGFMPGPLPPHSLLGLGVLGMGRSSSAVSNLGPHGDEALVDLVERHHSHSVPMLSERASHSLSGLMDEQGLSQSPSHSQGARELDKTHPCLTCLKLFRSKQQLAQHSLVHTGIRKHVCSFCDRAFKQLSHLQQHVRIHTGERKYMCKFCDRGFKQLSHLQKHTRIHTGEKPYRCKFESCERAFAQLSNLQHHMRNHDEQVKKEATRIHKCQICHRCYTNESSLKSHTLKMHIHIKPIDQHVPPVPKKKRKRKNKDLYGGAPTMVPVSSSTDGAFSGSLPGMKAGGSRPRSPASSSDEDEIIFVGEQVAPPRVDNFGMAAASMGGQGQMLQGPPGSRGHDLSHQIPFSGMGNFSRGADPLALLASANRFTLQDNMMSGLAGPLNTFSDQLAFRDAALLNSRFGDLRAGPSQVAGFDDRFSSSNFNQQQRDRDGFGSHSDMSSQGSGGSSGNNNSSSGGSSDNMQVQNGNSSENRNQAHNQGMLRGSGTGSLGSGVGGMMHSAGQGALGGLMKQIKQEPLDYFPSSCHGVDQFAGGGAGGFLSSQHIINTHLRGQLPSLNVPLIRDHFSHSQMLPHSSGSPTSVPNVTPSSSSSTTSLVSLPLPLTHMGLYHQSHFPAPQRMSGLHPSPASTPSGQMPVGDVSNNLNSQGGRSPIGQEDLRCFSPLRN